MKGKCPSLRGLTLRQVHLGVFDYSVHLAVGDRRVADRYVKWFHGTDRIVGSTEDSRGLCYYRVGYCPVVWIPEAPRTTRQIATATHECLHAVQHAMRWASIPASEDTDEIEAHTLGWVVKNLLDVAKLHKGKA